MQFNRQAISNRTRSAKKTKHRYNVHIPSVKEVFRCSNGHGQWQKTQSTKYLSADYYFVPTRKTIRKPIMNTDRLVRLWITDKITLQSSEE